MHVNSTQPSRELRPVTISIGPPPALQPAAIISHGGVVKPVFQKHGKPGRQRNPQNSRYPEQAAHAREQAQQQQHSMSNLKDPTSVEGQVKDATKDTAPQEQPGAFTLLQPSLALIVPIAVNLESVPRTGAGVVNDAGEVLDDAGNVVGKIADTSNLSNLVGNTVNSAGDVVSSTGDILGKTLPLGQGKQQQEEEHDDEHSEYTTQPAEKKKSGGLGLGGLGDTVGGLVGGVGKTAGDTVGGVGKLAGDTVGGVGKTTGDTAGGLTGSLGLEGKQEQSSTSPLADTPDTTKPFNEAKGQEVPEVKTEEQKEPDISLEDRDVPKEASETQEGLKDVPPLEFKDDDTSKAADLQKDLSGKTEEAKDKLPGDETEQKLPEDVTSKVDEQELPKTDVPEGLTDEAKEKVPEDVTSKVDDQELPKEDLPEGEGVTGEKLPEDVTSKLDEQEVPKGDLPEGAPLDEEELPKSQAPESEAPPSEIPPPSVPKSQAPESEAPLSKAPGDEAPGDDEQGSKAPGDEIPQSEIPGTEGLKSVAPGETALGEEVEGAEEKLDEGQEKLDEGQEEVTEPLDFTILKGTTVDKEGNLVNEKGHLIGRVTEGEVKQLIGMKCDDQGTIWGDFGKAIGKAEPLPEWERGEQKDFSVLKGTTVDKDGNLVNEKGHLMGRVVEGEVKQLIGMKCDDQGTIWGDFGKAIGKAEPLPEWERGEQKDFSILKNCKVDGDGNLVNDKGDTVGRVIDGEVRQLKGLKADENGKIWSDGKVVGKAEPLPEWERVQKKDYSVLKGTKVNKTGKLVNTNGDVLGKVIEGELKELIGKRADENGDIWNDSGEIIGKGEPVSVAEREDKAFAPFENFPDATVEADGRVLFEGRQVGEVIEGDPKHLKGSKVDEDGDILDRRGNVVGKAKAWDEPEPEAEVEVDKSALAGKRVNKAGNVVSRDGEIYGRVIEGHIGALVGRMCDKDGNVRSESGDIIGKAELVTEGEREGFKEGPFAELQGCTVSKDGKVVTPSGDVVGRLVTGDPKVLYGRAVDEDGDILDRNGNTIGKAERWEEPVVEKKRDPLAGRRVNREGNVNDDDGNLIGKLTSGDLLICSGKEVDEDGDVVNQKGQTIGHVTKLEDIPPEPEPEPEGESEEDRIRREMAEQEEAKQKEEAEKDKKLASALAWNIEQTLDKIRPICTMITNKIDAVERQPKEERDEEELVNQVRPLIEEGGKILTEVNGVIRGLDPDGRIQRNAKQKAATADASPEEYRLAELLKELTGSVTTCIDNAKRKLEGMPHAKKELNPLWGLLAEPLFQIIAAVGLLLNGVLGLVGKLLHGLGLGGILDGILGGLGLDKILSGLGLGDVIGSLTGKKKK
ncbi:hypothetical protein ACJZ2D_001261 [Fusarium nematophilum]